MKNDILVGFALALLTHLNAYGIITKGKRMLDDFRKKKKEKNTQPKHKNPPQNPNTLHTFLQILYGGIGCSARTSYRDQVVCALPSKTLLRSLTFFLIWGLDPMIS